MSIFNDSKNVSESFEKLFDLLPTEIKKHSERVGKISKFIFEKCLEENIYPDDFELTEENLEFIEEASKFHDIGKALLDDKVLKLGMLEKEAIQYIETHTTNILKIIDEDLLSECENPQLYSLMSDVALFHHERWDGRGYPNEYMEESIPICARIVAVANKLDHLMYPQVLDKMAKLEFPYAVKEIQNLTFSHFDPIIVAIVVKYELELNDLVAEIDFKNLSKKKKAKVLKKKTKKEEVSKSSQVSKEEEKREVQRDGPSMIFNLLPAYDVNEKEAEMITFDLVLNDIELGKIRRKDYFHVAERTNRLMLLIDAELKRMNEYAEALEKHQTNCTLDLYVSTKYLKTPNYFDELLKVLERYPKVWSRLCLTFDGYDFIDGDVEVDKLNFFKDRGIKVALDTRESLYSVPEILSMYKVDYVKLPFKLFKGISSRSKIAFENVMKTIEEYKVRPIVYEVDNYLEYMKCKELNFRYLQGDYMGVTDNNKISNFIHPRQAVWIKNE